MKKTYAHIGLSGLGSLGKITEKKIDINEQSILLVLKKAEQEKKFKVGDKLSFDDIDKLYNIGISEEEKRAWVWFKLNNNVSMRGWKKYYPPITGKGVNDVLVTTKTTNILDNAYRLIASVPTGTQLGSPTKFTNEYGNDLMVIFKAPDGAKRWVNTAHVTTKKVAQVGTESYVEQLVKKGVMFYFDGLYMPYPIYAFGNMYERELQLRTDEKTIIALHGKEIFDAQLEIIQTCKPKIISITNPSSTERPFISAISRFAREKDKTKVESFFIKNFKEDTGIDLQSTIKDQKHDIRNKNNAETRKVNQGFAESFDEVTEVYEYTLVKAFKIWLRTLPRTDFNEVTAEQIINYYLDAGQMGSDMEKEQKETISRYVPIEGEALFARFLYEGLTFDDQQRLDFLWNRLYNGQSTIPHHKVPIGFECSALFKSSILQFTPAQREAIAFLEIVGSGILAYDVGVGKTMAAIISLANNMQAGRFKRPLLVVPNPTYKKWIREIIGYKDEKTGEIIAGVMTGLNIKINDFYNLGVKVKYENKKVEEGSITIMTYQGFAKMGFSPKLRSELVSEFTDILMQNDSDTKSKRDIQKGIEVIKELVGEGNKNTVVDIDELGFDSIIIDEAHNFKNVFDSVNTDENGDKRYDIKGSSSPSAARAFMHCNYIQRTFGANVLLLTATPFSNTPIEIYSMLSLVGYQTLQNYKLYNLQRFMQNFVLQSLEYVNDYDGNISLKPVVKAYQNRLILQTIIYNHIAYKTGEEAGVKRPVKINLPRIKTIQNGKLISLPREEQVMTYLKPSDLQAAYQKDINSKAQSAKKLGDIGKAMNQSLDNALSPYIYTKQYSVGYDEFVEGSPKILYAVECIRTVKEWHESRGQTCSGQVIYSNRGKDFFPKIKQYLHEIIGFKKNVSAELELNGVKSKKRFDEVEIIDSTLDQDRKEDIKDAFLAGVVKVIIGTASIREGIDLQTRGTVIYNLYPEWNPTDIRQLEGRIWRQGNDFGYVRIVMPLVQDSMDVFVFQKLEEKTARINDIWYRSDRGNVLDVESLDPEEIKFALFTDIGKLVGIRADKIGKELNRKSVVIESNIDTMNQITASITQYNFNRTKCITLINQYYVDFEKYNKDADWDNIIKIDYYKRTYINNDPKKLKSLQDRFENWIEDAQQFLSEVAIDDKKIISILNRAIDIEEIGRSGYDYMIDQKRRVLSDFREALSKLRKAETTILKARGYTLNSNIAGIIEELKLEFHAVDIQKEELKTEEWKIKNYEEIAEIKAKTAITGKSALERAKEFATLNNLLAYSANEVTKDDVIPRNRGFILQSEAIATKNVDELRTRKMKLLKLKLQLQTQSLKLLLNINKKAA
jgi:hypothetical protein